MNCGVVYVRLSCCAFVVVMLICVFTIDLVMDLVMVPSFTIFICFSLAVLFI